MGITQKYRQDHETFLTKVREIEGLIQNPGQIKEQAKDIVMLLAKFSGILKMHLAMEDNHLYPALLKSEDPKVRELSARFQKEMGSLKATFDTYAAKWLSPTAVGAQPEQFKGETTELFKALHGRILRENDELYAAADKVVS